MRARHVLVAFATCAAVGLTATWGVGSLLTGATNAAVQAAPPPARTVALESEPGISVVGTYWPAKPEAAAILVLHGNGSNRGAVAARAAWLNGQGFAVFAIDFRGHGESTPAPKSFGLAESRDARAAFDWLRARHPGSRIAVMGYSLGGAASLLGEAGPLPADAFVFEAVYPDIRRAIFNRIAARLGSWPATFVEPWLSFQSLPRLGVWPGEIAPIRALARVDKPVMIVAAAPIPARRRPTRTPCGRPCGPAPNSSSSTACVTRNSAG